MEGKLIMPVLVFDLDDTLYDELSFVKSGFREVANYLSEKYSIPCEESYEYMSRRLKLGRGKIFDDLLKKFSIYSKEKVRKCISIYRQYSPNIKLYEDANETLTRLLKNYSLYIITDGNKIVQKNKLEALGLINRVKFSFITYRYGIKNSKPSPYCFYKICERENVKASDVVYIGDNPHKDFVGIKPLGFKTVRLIRGQYAEIKKDREYEADYDIRSLTELTEKFITDIFGKDNGG